MHHRKPLAGAVALNTAIFIVEAIAGYEANSLSLIMDSVHNFSDQVALVFLYLAFVLPLGISRNLLRSANIFNSVGIVAVSGVLLWQAVERIIHPAPVLGTIPVIVGLAAAAANWGVARLLRDPARNNAAIRLAYLHNLGDVQVSLAPVLSGLLVLVSGRFIFDALVAGGIALWLIVSTLREVIASHEELIWPEKINCGHSDHDQEVIPTHISDDDASPFVAHGLGDSSICIPSGGAKAASKSFAWLRASPLSWLAAFGQTVTRNIGSHRRASAPAACGSTPAPACAPVTCPPIWYGIEVESECSLSAAFLLSFCSPSASGMPSKCSSGALDRPTLKRRR
jgi:Co/Zn/Cd efflux system component